MCLGRDGADGVCVPDDQVGVGAHGDPALTRVQVQDLGCVGAGDGNKHVLVHLARRLGDKHKQTGNGKQSHSRAHVDISWIQPLSLKFF